MIAWAVETLVASSILMLAVLALRGPVRRWAGPQVAYALWAIPALRMILPPLPAALRPIDSTPIGAAIEPGTIMLGVPVATIPAVPEGWGMATVPAALVAFWLCGGIAFLGWHVVGHVRFCRRIADGARRRYRVAGDRVAVLESAHAAGPMAFGVWQRRVAFPADFAERYDEAERDLALAHELGHHARGDLLANWCALAILAAHWFNPIAWRAFRAFRADQEMACDAMVLGDRPDALRHAYGRAIVKSAHGGAVSAACHLHTINDIKGRLRMLTLHRRATRGQIMGGATGLVALTIGALALTASGTQATERFRDRVEGTIGVKLDDIRLPAPPLRPGPAVALQDMPAAPVVPSAPAAPAAPVVGETDLEWTAEDGSTQSRRFVLDQTPEQLAAIAERGIDVDSRHCGPGDGFTVTEKNADGSDRMVICTDRVEAHATAAAGDVARYEAMAQATKVQALAAARSSIAAARATIANEPNLSAEERAEALAELDEAVREIEAEERN